MLADIRIIMERDTMIDRYLISTGLSNIPDIPVVSSVDLRVRALFEVSLVFILLCGASRVFSALPSGKWIEYACVFVLFAVLVSQALMKKDFSRYGISPIPADGEMKTVLVFAASMFFLMLGGIWVACILVLLSVTGRDFSRYGITMRGLKSDLKVVAICIVPVMAVDCAAPGLKTGELSGSLIFSVLIVILLFVLLLLLRTVPYREDPLRIRAGYLIPALIAGSVIAIISIATAPESYDITGIADYVPLAINAVAFGFVLQAIPQQILFWGFIQPRLNEAFGRPYQLLGVPWGAGLIVTALFFGVLHAFNMFNPFRGDFDVLPLWGVWTFFFGLVYGFIREKTGSITASAIIHGTEDTFSYLAWSL
jgi:membrane protease YdiL (CAAX protease family)